MNKALLATLVSVVMVSGAGCGRSGNVESRGTDASGPVVWRPSPGHRSACSLTTHQTGNATVVVDWVDVLQLNGTQYIAGLDGDIPAIPADQLGPVLGRVSCKLSALTFSTKPGPLVDGDAAFIDVGTAVHAVHGYSPACRVAARIAGENRVYLAHADDRGVSKALPCATAAGTHQSR